MVVPKIILHIVPWCLLLLSDYCVQGMVNRMNDVPSDLDMHHLFGIVPSGHDIAHNRFGFLHSDFKTPPSPEEEKGKHVLKIQTAGNFGHATKHAFQAVRHTMQGLGSLLGAKLGLGVGAIAGTVTGAAHGIYKGAKRGAYLGAEYGAKPFGKIDKYETILKELNDHKLKGIQEFQKGLTQDYKPEIHSDEDKIKGKEVFEIFDKPHPSESKLSSRYAEPRFNDRNQFYDSPYNYHKYKYLPDSLREYEGSQIYSKSPLDSLRELKYKDLYNYARSPLDALRDLQYKDSYDRISDPLDSLRSTHSYNHNRDPLDLLRERTYSDYYRYPSINPYEMSHVRRLGSPMELSDNHDSDKTSAVQNFNSVEDLL